MQNLLTFLAASVAVAQRTGIPPPLMNGTITTTIVVNSFVTYCPQPTVFTWKDVCYTAKTPGPVTVTNCPCTITTVSNISITHVFMCVYVYICVSVYTCTRRRRYTYIYITSPSIHR